MAWKGQEYSWARLWCQLPLAEVQAVVGEQKNTRLRSELQLPYRAEGTQKKEHCESHSLSIKLLEFCFSTGAEHETQSLSRLYLTVWKHRHFDKLQIHITEAWLWDCKNLFKLTQARSCWAQAAQLELEIFTVFYTVELSSSGFSCFISVPSAWSPM